MEQNEAGEQTQGGRREGDKNEARIIGRLTDKAGVKNYGEGGDARVPDTGDKLRAQFTLAVERPGRGKPFHDYILVTAWRALAHQAAALGKGDVVEVEGRLRTWQGEKGRGWGIEADMLQVIKGKTPAKTAAREEATAAA